MVTKFFEQKNVAVLLDLLQVVEAFLDVVIRALELFGHAFGAFLM